MSMNSRTPEGMVSLLAAANALKIHRSKLDVWCKQGWIPTETVQSKTQRRFFVRMEDVVNAAVVKNYFLARGWDIGEVKTRPEPQIEQMAKVYEKRGYVSPSNCEPLYAGSRA